MVTKCLARSCEIRNCGSRVVSLIPCLALSFVLAAAGANADTTKDAHAEAGKAGTSPGTAGPATAAPISPAESLSSNQQQLAAEYKDFQSILMKMRDQVRQIDPNRAALIEKALKESGERQVDSSLQDIVDLLHREKFGDAVRQQGKVGEDMDAILKLLMSEDRSRQILDQKALLRKYLNQINGIIRDQKDVQGRTAGGDDPKSLSGEQGGLAQRTSDLSKDIRETQEGASKNGDKGDKGADKGDAKGDSNSKPGEKNGEKGDGKGGKPGEKGDSKSAGKDGKPGDGKAKADDGKSKPGDNKSKPGDEKAKPGDGKSKPGDGKSKPGDGKSKPGDGKSKPGDGKSQGQGQGEGKSQSQGKGQQGQSQGQGQEQQGEPSDSPPQAQDPSNPPQEQNPVRKRLEAAREHMEQGKSGWIRPRRTGPLTSKARPSASWTRPRPNWRRYSVNFVKRK